MTLPRLGPNSPLRSSTGKAPTLAQLRKKLIPHEKHDQTNLFSWAEAQSGRWPELQEMYAIPNAGGFTGGFKKNRGRVMAMLKQGVKPGVPDVHLPVARGGFNSLYVEMKREGEERPTPEQLDWHRRLRARGNCVVVAVGFVAACDALVTYLDQGGRDKSPNPPRREQRGPTSLIGDSP